MHKNNRHFLQLHLVWLLAAFLGTGPAIGAPAAESNSDENYRAPSTVQGKTIFIPAGSTFEGRIDTRIGSSVSRPGQRFALAMSSPVLANGVDVLIPAGSQILGEVVEAISSGRQPHPKGTVKPTGKLRIQINGLRLPDGTNYPLVASLVGESAGRYGARLGSGVGYVGSAASFEAVAPGSAQRYGGRSRGRGPNVVTREQMLRDPLYGQSRDQNWEQSGASIRSLVKRGYELYIDQGSPLSVRLDAPLKMVLGQSTPASNPGEWTAPVSGKRFGHSAQPPVKTPSTSTEPPAGQPDNSF